MFIHSSTNTCTVSDSERGALDALALLLAGVEPVAVGHRRVVDVEPAEKLLAFLLARGRTRLLDAAQHGLGPLCGLQPEHHAGVHGSFHGLAVLVPVLLPLLFRGVGPRRSRALGEEFVSLLLQVVSALRASGRALAIARVGGVTLLHAAVVVARIDERLVTALPLLLAEAKRDGVRQAGASCASVRFLASSLARSWPGWCWRRGPSGCRWCVW